MESKQGNKWSDQLEKAHKDINFSMSELKRTVEYMYRFKDTTMKPSQQSWEYLFNTIDKSNENILLLQEENKRLREERDLFGTALSDVMAWTKSDLKDVDILHEIFNVVERKFLRQEALREDGKDG